MHTLNIAVLDALLALICQSIFQLWISDCEIPLSPPSEYGVVSRDLHEMRESCLRLVTNFVLTRDYKE
jgi:hypothetical protein